MSSGQKGHELRPAYASVTVGRREVLVAGGLGLITGVARPATASAPSLAESVKASEDGRSYDFVIREGAVFHNGEPVTSADVKFSFDRYPGGAPDLLQSRVAAGETPGA